MNQRVGGFCSSRVQWLFSVPKSSPHQQACPTHTSVAGIKRLRGKAYQVLSTSSSKSALCSAKGNPEQKQSRPGNAENDIHMCNFHYIQALLGCSINQNLPLFTIFPSQLIWNTHFCYSHCQWMCVCVCVCAVHLDAHCSLPCRCGSCRTVWTFHPVPSTLPPPAGGFAMGFDVQCGQCGTGQTHLKGSAGTFGYQVLCVSHWYQKWWSGQLIQLVLWDFMGQAGPVLWVWGLAAVWSTSDSSWWCTQCPPLALTAVLGLAVHLEQEQTFSIQCRR